MPAGPTRVQLLVKIAIIGTKLTHRTKAIETLELSLKDKDKVCPLYQKTIILIAQVSVLKYCLLILLLSFLIILIHFIRL